MRRGFPEEHHQNTYTAAKKAILYDPNDPFGKGLADQLFNESRKMKWGKSLASPYKCFLVR